MESESQVSRAEHLKDSAIEAGEDVDTAPGQGQDGIKDEQSEESGHSEPLEAISAGKGKALATEPVLENAKEPTESRDQSEDKTTEPAELSPQTSPALSHDMMESSTATLRPFAILSANPAATAHYNSHDEHNYLDPTPRTPAGSQPPSRTASNAASIPQSRLRADVSRSPTRSDAGFDEKASTSGDERETGSRSEIQSIMDQFAEDGQGPGVEEVMSPRLEFAGPLLGSPLPHPPRKSSLEPLNAAFNNATQGMQELNLAKTPTQSIHSRDPTDIGPAVPPKPGSLRGFGNSRIPNDQYSDSPLSPPSLHRPPPPEPEPEPDLPFDFHSTLR